MPPVAVSRPYLVAMAFGISRRGILGPVVEVAIAVVVESCCQVVVLVAICTEVRAEIRR